MFDSIRTLFFRLAASGWIPARWFESELPTIEQRSAKTGRLKVEVVSHCWQYSHLLVYQLSSLVEFPPTRLDVVMTVYYNDEDVNTRQLLEYFATISLDNVTWHWQPLSKPELFRRGIGRNKAALGTTADWVWFTDCDLMFRENCLDHLSDLLQGRREALYFPLEERTTELLAEDDPVLNNVSTPSVKTIDTSVFEARTMTRATGPLQIAHGDVCRKVGYCRSIGIYQQPSETWCKAHEDRAFRWLLQSQGVALPIPGVYRIRHLVKGRYTGTKTGNSLRTIIRKIQSWFRD